MKIGVTSKLPPEKGAAGPSGPGDGARAVAAAALGWWGVAGGWATFLVSIPQEGAGFQKCCGRERSRSFRNWFLF